MRSAELRKLNRGLGSRRAGDAASAMEFSDLLDAVTPRPMAVIPSTDSAIADLVMFRVSPQIDDQPAPPMEPSVEPALDPIVEAPEKIIVVSRFAGSGIDDDLLPVRAPSRRRLRR